MSFFNIGLQERLDQLGCNHYLAKIQKLIDWNQVEKLLYTRFPQKPLGRDRYSPLKMFKAILLGQWHTLSDPALEEALCVRLDFIAFTQFAIGDPLPDETTLCRFRNELIASGLHEKLLDLINSNLMNQGIMIQKSEGAVVDATLIASTCRPRRQVDCTESEPKFTASADAEARWLKKGSKSHFGYQGFVRTSSEQGFIEKVHVTSANLAETKELPRAIAGITGRRVYGDKGFPSKRNAECLKKQKCRNGIMSKASRAGPLSYWQKQRNKAISKRRYIVEQAFGTLKRKFLIGKASYRGCLKVEGQLHLKAICFNLLKAHRSVQMR